MIMIGNEHSWKCWWDERGSAELLRVFLRFRSQITLFTVDAYWTYIVLKQSEKRGRLRCTTIDRNLSVTTFEYLYYLHIVKVYHILVTTTPAYCSDSKKIIQCNSLNHSNSYELLGTFLHLGTPMYMAFHRTSVHPIQTCHSASKPCFELD